MAFNLTDWLVGHSPKGKKMGTLTPEQQSYQNQVLQGGRQGTQFGFDYINDILGGGDESFNRFAEPYKRQFEREIIPGIAERFAGMGTGGAQDSSAFQQTLGQAGRDFGTNLASMREQMKMQALSQLQSLLQPGMAKSFENVYDPGAYGVLGGMFAGAGEGAGKAALAAFL